MTTADDDTPVAPGVQDDSVACLPANVGGTGPVGAGTRTRTRTRTTEEEEFVDNYDVTLDDNDEYSGPLLRRTHFAAALECMQGCACFLRWIQSQQVGDIEETGDGEGVLGDLLQCNQGA